MTSEPDSNPRRRPPTIDLTATEIEREKPPAGPDSGNGEAVGAAGTAANFAERLRPHFIGGAAGAILMAAIAFGLWVAGVAPSANVAPAGTNNNAAPAISAQLDKIQAALQAQPAEQALAARLTSVEAQTKSLSDSLAAITHRLDEVAAATQTAGQHADAAAAAARNAATSSVQRGDLEALSQRIAALEGTVKTLADDVTRRAGSADDRMARAAVAAEALRAVVERGAPYQAELAQVKSLGADPDAVAALEPFAASGVPGTTELAHELAALAPSLLKAADAGTADGSFLGRLENNAKNLVRVTPVDAPQSDEPSAVIVRLNAEAARGDIAGAQTDIGRLPPSAKALADPWMAKAHAREAAIAAARRIAATALTGLANTGTQ